jgi:hypothetical protein
MSHKMILAICLASLAAVAAPATIWAAVPTNVIRGWQNNAPEALEIAVMSVAKGTPETRAMNGTPGGVVTKTSVTLVARVDVVHRSASNLQPGAVIVVKYIVQRSKPRVPDGDYGLMLNNGERARAYLKPAGDRAFELAGAVGCLEKL